MAKRLDDLFMTEEEYLSFEGKSDQQHEYVAGRVFLMTGGTAAHSEITANLSECLRRIAKKLGCHVYSHNLKVKVATSFYYPDVIYTCEPYQPDALWVTAPILIVEVLSPSTQSTDRREKLFAYREIPSLMQYLIVSQKERKIELYCKDQGSWRQSVFVDSDALSLESIPVVLKLDDIYDGTGL